MSCNGTDALLQQSYCATYNMARNTTEIGACIFRNKYYKYLHYEAYYSLPKKASELTEAICGEVNRTGTLCGRCLPDHYPLAYSFNMTCVPCPHPHWNWLWYIMAAYLPLTLFYFIILFFKINAVSSHLFAVVYYCQMLSLPAVLRNIMTRIMLRANPDYLMAGKIIVSIYGIWNLDFFRAFYSDLCLGIGVLPTLALDYAIAVYPLLLMVVSYLLITLYDRNYRVVTAMWSPFQRLFSLFRRNWNIRTSVIDSYATFFLLSYVKFLSVSFDLLAPTRVYRLYEDRYNHTWALYYAGHLEYFGKEHLPYGVLAIVVLCFFVILPALTIAFYPFKFFQKFLSLFPVRWFFLRTLMDTFQGCYKDGTAPGTRDCRWFPSVFFAVRLILLLVYFGGDYTMFIVLSTLTLTLHSTLVVMVQPFKPALAHFTLINVVFLQFMVLQLVLNVVMVLAATLSDPYLHVLYTFMAILACIPLLYATISISHWVYKHRKFSWEVRRRLGAWRRGYARLPEPSEAALPDRIENPENYPSENLTNFVSTQSSSVEN